MKDNIYLAFFLSLLTLCIACDKEVDDQVDDPQYSITINSPTTDDKHLNDAMHIHVDFESATNQTVHHINIRIYNKADQSTEIYNGPGEAHVHADSGNYEHHDDLELNAANGVSAHTDWILEAKVWGHEAGVAEVIAQIEFHVHPE